jgi:threonine/homoserine/homoserine lactone efflux protein
MELSTWLLFSSIALVATISPGPAILLSVTNSLMYGFTKSLYSSLGNITGILVVSIAAALGLGAVLQTSTLLFTTLKFSGAIYLIYLGIRQWQSKRIVFTQSIETPKPVQGKNKLFVQGSFVAISNPKAVLFFTAFFPQFVDLSKPIMIQFFILTTTFMIFSFLSLAIYALTARSVTGWFVKGDRALWFNRILGTIFITFGLGMLRLRNGSA